MSATIDGLSIEWMPISKLSEYEDNPRVIPSRAISSVAKSLEKFGWRQPIVVDANYVIVSGHTRLKAAVSLNMTEVPVHVANDLTDDEIKEYRIVDNRSAEFAEWDFSLLEEEAENLNTSVIDWGFIDTPTYTPEYQDIEDDDPDDYDEDDEVEYDEDALSQRRKLNVVIGEHYFQMTEAELNIWYTKMQAEYGVGVKECKLGILKTIRIRMSGTPN